MPQREKPGSVPKAAAGAGPGPGPAGAAGETRAGTTNCNNVAGLLIISGCTGDIASTPQPLRDGETCSRPPGRLGAGHAAPAPHVARAAFVVSSVPWHGT